MCHSIWICKITTDLCVIQYGSYTGEQHPRSHHKSTISMQTHPAVRIGFELATNSIQFYVLPNRTRHDTTETSITEYLKMLGATTWVIKYHALVIFKILTKLAHFLHLKTDFIFKINRIKYQHLGYYHLYLSEPLDQASALPLSIFLPQASERQSSCSQPAACLLLSTSAQ